MVSINGVPKMGFLPRRLHMPDPPKSRRRAILKLPNPKVMWVQRVGKGWTPAILLSKEGFFTLDDVIEIMEVRTVPLKSDIDKIQRAEGGLFQEMGLYWLDDHWVVRIELFGSYYVNRYLKKIQPVEDHWDRDTLLGKRGIFYLMDVCKLMSLKYKSLRHKAHKNPNSKQEWGIWKDAKAKTYLADMEIFGPWIQTQPIFTILE